MNDEKPLNTTPDVRDPEYRDAIFVRRSCRRCFGRGWIGKIVATGQPYVCSCVRVVKVRVGKENTQA